MDGRKERKYKDKYRKSKKNKAYIAESSWSDSSNESESERNFENEEYATVCFMAREEDKVCNSTLSIEEAIYKHDELATLYLDLEKAFDNLLKTK